MAALATASLLIAPPASAQPGGGSEPTATKIHEIQGSGSEITGPGPFEVEAIVVGDFQRNDQLQAFWSGDSEEPELWLIDINPAGSFKGIYKATFKGLL